MLVSCLLLGVSLAELEPQPTAQILFEEDFADITSDTGSAWVASSEGATKYELAVTTEVDGDNLVLTPKFGDSNHFAISAKLAAPLPSFADAPPLVVQYDVTYNTPVTCGGSYIKLMTATGEAAGDVSGDSKYTIMFGPDYCNLKPRIHFIFTLEYPDDSSRTMEVHCKQGKLSPSFFNDRKTHLLTLILNGDNTYVINVDNEEYSKGNIGDEADCAPTVPKEVLNPYDTKPEDWVDEAEVADPEHAKPADWVTVEEIADPTATMPEDWIEEDDGEWEAPYIKNPEFKVWDQKMIENPEYKGKWEQKKMPNPEYFHEPNPFHKLKPVDGVAFELVVNDPGLELDNVLLVGGLGLSPIEAARTKANETWNVRRTQQDAAALAAAEAGDFWGFGAEKIAAAAVGVVVLVALLFWYCSSGGDDGDDKEGAEQSSASGEKAAEKTEKSDGEKKKE